jgi:phosphate transport system permease protein
MGTPTAALPEVRKRPVAGHLSGGDGVAWALTLFFALLILIVTVMLVVQLWNNSALTRMKFGFEFLTSTVWNQNSTEARPEAYGALPFIYGTCVTAFLALLISVPFGVGAAIYLAELAPPKISNGLTFLIELLAAVPSVIFGLIAIFSVVPIMRTTVEPAIKKVLGFLPIFSGPAYGFGYLTAGLVLSIMTFPYIISVSREAILSVPREQREAALALGATQWESTWDAVLPFARLGIIGSIFLALARALGETMAVTMVIGNDPKINTSLLSQGYTLASVIANEFPEAVKLHSAALVELALVLFVLTMAVNAMAQLMIVLTTRKGSAKA